MLFSPGEAGAKLYKRYLKYYLACPLHDELYVVI